MASRYPSKAVSRTNQFRVLVAITIGWAAWAGWSLMSRSTPYELLVLDDLGTPVASANVDGGGVQLGISDESGRVRLEWKSESVLEVSAPGHITKMVTVATRPEDAIPVVLTARVFRGRVVDTEGLPVSAALVKSQAGEGVSDAEGRVSIRGAETGTMEITRPAWNPTTFTWDGGPGEANIVLEPFIAKAVHVGGDAIRDRYSSFLEMADNTELNALMLDLKDESGLVWYNTTNAVAMEIGAAANTFNLADVVGRARAKDLYVIGRIVLFTDPIASIKKPSMAVWNQDTGAPFVANNQYFLDPTDPDARQYGLDLAKEACAAGVQEIQFDYVRFTEHWPNYNLRFDEPIGRENRIATITGFLTAATELLHPMGCAVAADVFGFITSPGTEDGGIGQNWVSLTDTVDVVSPMVYPSHYDRGWYGFDNPNANPGPMVTAALTDGLNRLARNVIVRPWLQDFGSTYGPAEVRAQIDAAESFGLGWMLWNARSVVTVDALRPE